MNIVEARRYARNTRPSRVDDSDFYPFDGGLNLTETPLQLKPGELIGALNYEISTEGGYVRVRGFERIDGRTKPSAAQYGILAYDGGIPANYPAAGVTVNGQTSGATAVVLAAPADTATGVGMIVLGRVTGTFQDNENLRVSATVFAVADGTVSFNSASIETDHDAYLLLAATDMRAQIGAVPGSGPVRGVVTYRGVDYAFRDNVGATACVMHKATAGGWVAISAYPLIRFTGGVTEILPGQTVTGFTSTHTGVVRRVVVKTGSWGGGTAAGFLILAPGAGAFQNAENLQVSAATVAVASGTAAAQVIPAGGKYEFRVHNFYGHSGSIRLYGVNGVGKAFEYQDGGGEFFCPIETGMTSDIPTHLAVHKAYLWLSFSGGSVQKSGVADPAVFSVITGAAEIGIGDEITGFLEETFESMFVLCRNRMATIVGDGPDFSLKPFAGESGAYEGTIQRIGKGMFLDDRGFTTLAASQNYGNFSSSSFSARINPMIAEIRKRAVCSSVSRTRNAYRLFLDDGRFISIGLRGDKIVGHMNCDLGVPMSCAWSGEDAAGTEHLLLGGQDGYVYQMDSGRNMDGEEIVFFCRLPFHFSRSPSRIKRYRRAEFDLRLEGRATLSIAPEYSYGKSDVKNDPLRQVVLAGGGGFWNVANWNEFVWSDGPVAGAAVKLDGSGTSVGFLVAGRALNEPPHTLQGVKLHQSFRRLNREAMA